MDSRRSVFHVLMILLIKVGFSPSKKNCFICFNESPLRVMKNAFYFILNAVFVLKISRFLCWLFGHVEKMAIYKDKINFKIYDVTAWLTNS